MEPFPSPFQRAVAAPTRFARGVYVAWFACLFLSLVPFTQAALGHMDEATLLAEAKRTLLYGELQHRDYFDFQGPANIGLIAAAGRFQGGVDHRTAKLLAFLAALIGGVSLTQVARRFTDRLWLSLLPSLIYTGYLAHYFPSANHHWFGSAATCVFLRLLVDWAAGTRARAGFTCGVAGAVSLLFLVHEGLVNLAIGGLAPWFFGDAFAAAQPRPADEAGGCAVPRTRSVAREIALYLAGVVAVLAPFAGICFRLGMLEGYLYNTFAWPMLYYMQPGSPARVSWGGELTSFWVAAPPPVGPTLHFLSAIAAMVLALWPVATLAVGAAVLWRPAVLPPRSATGRRFALLLLHSAGTYATALASQSTLLKLSWGAAPSLALAVWLLDGCLRNAAASPLLRRALGTLVAGVAVSFLAVVLFRVVEAGAGRMPDHLALEPLDPQASPTVELINRESGADDYVFAHPLASSIYFLAEARPATRYTVTVANYMSPQQLRDMFDDIERHSPKFMAFRGMGDLLWLVERDERLKRRLSTRYRQKEMPDGWIVLRRQD